MPQPSVAVLGVGSLRAGPHIVAALASCPSDVPLDIRLWDGSGERLDLFDRFLRTCLEITDYGHVARSFSDPAEALDGSPAIILCLHEDGARRHLQPAPEIVDEPEPAVPETSMSIVEFGLGDPNRPTPRGRLSASTRSVVFQPSVEGTREEVILEELDLMRPLLEGRGPLLNLTRDVAMPYWLNGESMEWPETLSQSDLSARPHQILRWIQADPTIAAFIESSWGSPVSQWLQKVI